MIDEHIIKTTWVSDDYEPRRFEPFVPPYSNRRIDRAKQRLWREGSYSLKAFVSGSNEETARKANDTRLECYQESQRSRWIRYRCRRVASVSTFREYQ